MEQFILLHTKNKKKVEDEMYLPSQVFSLLPGTE